MMRGIVALLQLLGRSMDQEELSTLDPPGLGVVGLGSSSMCIHEFESVSIVKFHFNGFENHS